MSVLDKLSHNASVVVIRLRSVGDIVLTTPALQLLAQARPDLHVSVVVDDAFAALLEGVDFVDEIIPAERDGKSATIALIRRVNPRLCLNLHGGSTSAWMTALSGAHHRAGFGHFRLTAPYNIKIPRAQEVLGLDPQASVHTAEHLASAVFHLGVPVAEIPQARLAAEPLRRDRMYAVLHVSAAYHTKQWPKERFRAVAGLIAERHGLEPVLIAGPGQDALLDDFAEWATMPGLDIRGLKNLLAGASLFVGNDSGPAHIAAAFGVPCAVIFGSSSSKVWGPWRARSEVIETEWECKPCPGDRCYAYDEPRCILSVEQSRVEQAVARLLA